MVLCSNQIAILIDKYNRLTSQIAAANDTLDALVRQQIESFTLNTGEGSQSSKRWDMAHIEDSIAKWERRLESIRQRLSGLGVMNLNVRRKGDL